MRWINSRRPRSFLLLAVTSATALCSAGVLAGTAAATYGPPGSVYTKQTSNCAGGFGDTVCLIARDWYNKRDNLAGNSYERWTCSAVPILTGCELYGINAGGGANPDNDGYGVHGMNTDYLVVRVDTIAGKGTWSAGFCVHLAINTLPNGQRWNSPPGITFAPPGVGCPVPS
jgi:hypothetical protein